MTETTQPDGLEHGEVQESPARNSVLERGLDLIEAFESGEPLSLAELSRRTRLPKSSVHRLTRGLLARGVLERTADGKLSLGIRLFEIGSRVQAPHRLRELALPSMRDLAYRFPSATVHLAVLKDFDIVYVERVRGRQSLRLPTAVGNRFPAHASALGKALLAYQDALSPPRTLLAMGPKAVTDPRFLARDLHLIRERGLSVEREESYAGVSCVAAPILTRQGKSYAALSLSGDVKRPLPPNPLEASLRQAAQQIASRLPAGMGRAV
ncbi:IclR family transcriptional regulator [Rhodococcus sp. NPDC055024]